MEMHMRYTTPVSILGTVSLVLALAGCTQQTNAGGAQAPVTKAVAVLHPTQGNDISGVVTFTRQVDGIHVVAHINGLEPGDHGFHIHQYGDCSAADGTSAGGHFNPAGMAHSGPTDAERHVGDLGNVTANASGHAMLDVVDPHLTFDGAHSIIGRGVILHDGADDLTSQPSGAAGPRVACGVIGIAQGE